MGRSLPATAVALLTITLAFTGDANPFKPAKLRAKIVKMAASQIGLVKDARGPDGFKIGWKHLEEYYKVAYGKDTLPAYTLDGLKKVGGRAKYAKNWCGIFGIWAANRAGVSQARWGSQGKAGWGPVGVGKARTDIQNMQPGDIVIFKGKLIHHAVVEKIAGSTLHTIDGNGVFQQIARNARPLSSVWYYYRTVSDTPPSAGGPGAANPPANPGIGYVTHKLISVKNRASAKGSWVAALGRCAPVKILQRNVQGPSYSWSQVSFNGKSGYVASNLISESVPSGCKAVAPPPATTPPPAATPPVKKPRRKKGKRSRKQRKKKKKKNARKPSKGKRRRARSRRRKKGDSRVRVPRRRTKRPRKPVAEKPATPPAKPVEPPAKPIEPPPAPVTRIGYIAKHNTVVVRQGPSTSSAQVTYLGKCQEVSILGEPQRAGNGWLWTKISAKGKVGYVGSNLITTEKSRCR